MKENAPIWPESGMQVEHVLKILLVGAPKSGKTSFVRRLCDKAFREEYMPTLGFDVIVVPYGNYQGRPVSLQLWDVAGSQLNARPCHHALIGSRADGVLYVLDVTSRDSLQAVDEWDRALSRYLPPWSCKLLVGHKADLPVYVVNDEALSLYVAGAGGFRGWCLTVGNSDYGDYDVAARRGGGGARGSDAGGRYKGQSLSGEKQLSVSEAVRTLIGHVFRAGGAGGAGGAGARPAAVVGLGASASGVSPLPSMDLDAALDTVRVLGLGGQAHAEDSSGKGSPASAARGKENRASREDSKSMQTLLRRGRGPDSSWKTGRTPPIHAKTGQLATSSDTDAGWKYFAGRMGREEAEALLSSSFAYVGDRKPSRGRPEGTFFLRRKSPSILVLTYVSEARSGSGSGGGSHTSGVGSRKSLGPTSLRPLSWHESRSMTAEGLGRRISMGSEGFSGGMPDAESGGCGDLNTFVQHALLVHEGGCFSDERARLGRFATLEQLLKSKISAIARHPLTFRREQDRYVLIEDSPKDAPSGTENVPADTPATREMKATSGGADKNIKGSDQASKVMRDYSFSRQQQGMTASPPASGEHQSSRLGSQSPLLGEKYAKSASDRNAWNSNISSMATSSTVRGEWADRRARKSTARSPLSVSGGSLWMEAAAAVQKWGGNSSGAGKTRRRTSKGTVANSGRTRAGSGGTALVPGAHQKPRKGSVSSTEDGSVSSSAAESTEGDRAWLLQDRILQQQAPQVQQQTQQHPWKGTGDLVTGLGIEAAALSAAAATAAANHPEAKQLLEKLFTADTAVNTVTDTLEVQMRPIVTRTRPTTSHSSSMDAHGFFSVRDLEETPRFDAAATLLVKRARSSRDTLINSMNTIRGRAITLAMEETACAAGTAGVSGDPGSSSPPTPRGLVGRMPQLHASSRITPNIGSDVHHVYDKGQLKPPGESGSVASKGEDHGHHATTGTEGVPRSVGPALSTCQDFERVLGEVESTPELPYEQYGVGRTPGTSELGWHASISDGGGAHIGPASDMLAGRRGHSALPLPSRDRQRSGSPGAKTAVPDSWRSILSDVQLVEERCRAFVVQWESTAAIMADVVREGLDSCHVYNSECAVAR